jgi:IS30 family transposase
LPTVSHETIYRAIYVLPRGQIRREIVSFLRQHHKERLPLRRRTDRRGGMIGMVSIHERPADVLGREFPGDWEGDLIKGAGNASAIGTLIERKSRFTILVKMKDCSSRAALIGFRRELGKVPAAMRTSLAYDQGTEMARHAELSKALKMKVYFCDPHSPWQRPSNENMNGLVRQYLPKGCELSIYAQKDLNAIAESLNTRPRACLDFQTPMEVFAAECAKLERTAA